MPTRHSATTEIGGWVLLVATIVALLYFLFAKKTVASGTVSNTIGPTSGVPKITSDIADQIANGTRTARVYTPGSGSACGSGETVMDAGSGNLWCVGAPSSPVYGADTFRVGD